MSAFPATLEAMPFTRAAAGRDGAVERERPIDEAADDLAAVGHLRQRGRVQGRPESGVDGLDGGEDRDLGRRDADRERQVDRVLDDVALGRQIRCDVERRVGDQQRARVARHAP